MIEATVGEVAYRLRLPPQLAKVHPVFHVSMLRKYVRDPSHVVDFGDLHVEEDATYITTPVEILDAKDQTLRRKTIRLVKVLWRTGTVEEMTWEREDVMQKQYPELFANDGMCLHSFHMKL
ncbi:hypothetical protein JQN44_27260 [Klebsiella pneumoniae]|uniref:hypothetical protein n=1 Tax=Klebsiella pneumoniae TaxID=573 RepID=UPI00193A3E2D|nr:hypothetical protein [Klebsiella pneumoniae]MBM1124180.1 hypothetical protein [Klebsiella pneumoniae]